MRTLHHLLMTSTNGARWKILPSRGRAEAVLPSLLDILPGQLGRTDIQCQTFRVRAAGGSYGCRPSKALGADIRHKGTIVYAKCDARIAKSVVAISVEVARYHAATR